MSTDNTAQPTDREVEILRHTLGLKRGDVAYRNHFCADVGHDDMPQLESLVSKGLMRKRTDSLGPGFVFYATAEGVLAARTTGARDE